MSKLSIDSKYVGVPWKEIEKEIPWRLTTNYAAAIDDINPFYFDGFYQRHNQNSIAGK